MTVLMVPISDDEPDTLVAFDVDVDDEDGTEPLAKRRDGSTVAARSLAASLDGALPALSLVLSKVRAAAAGCEEISLQMGLRVAGETGLVFVRGGADATIGVTLTWRSTPRPPADQEAADHEASAGQQASAGQRAAGQQAGPDGASAAGQGAGEVEGVDSA